MCPASEIPINSPKHQKKTTLIFKLVCARKMEYIHYAHKIENIKNCYILKFT